MDANRDRYEYYYFSVTDMDTVIFNSRISWPIWMRTVTDMDTVVYNNRKSWLICMRTMTDTDTLIFSWPIWMRTVTDMDTVIFSWPTNAGDACCRYYYGSSVACTAHMGDVCCRSSVDIYGPSSARCMLPALLVALICTARHMGDACCRRY